MDDHREGRSAFFFFFLSFFLFVFLCLLSLFLPSIITDHPEIRACPNLLHPQLTSAHPTPANPEDNVDDVITEYFVH